jgi:hypothetical protein
MRMNLADTDGRSFAAARAQIPNEAFIWPLRGTRNAGHCGQTWERGCRFDGMSARDCRWRWIKTSSCRFDVHDYGQFLLYSELAANKVNKQLKKYWHEVC